MILPHPKPIPQHFRTVELIGGPHDGTRITVHRDTGGLSLMHGRVDHFYANLADDGRLIHRPRLTIRRGVEQ